jgi:hypothetical protein
MLIVKLEQVLTRISQYKPLLLIPQKFLQFGPLSCLSMVRVERVRQNVLPHLEWHYRHYSLHYSRY